MSVPRMWNVLYNQYQRALFVALSANRDKDAKEQRRQEDIEAEVLKHFKGLLGNRITKVGTGSAAISPEVSLCSCVCCHALFRSLSG